jgi:hypothetical protein
VSQGNLNHPDDPSSTTVPYNRSGKAGEGGSRVSAFPDLSTGRWAGPSAARVGGWGGSSERPTDWHPTDSDGLWRPRWTAPGGAGAGGGSCPAKRVRVWPCLARNVGGGPGGEGGSANPEGGVREPELVFLRSGVVPADDIHDARASFLAVACPAQPEQHHRLGRLLRPNLVSRCRRAVAARRTGRRRGPPRRPQAAAARAGRGG